MLQLLRVLSVSGRLVHLPACQPILSFTTVYTLKLRISSTVAYLVEGEAWIAGDGKVEVERQVVDILGGIASRGLGLDLGQAVADEPDAVDEQAVGGALDLKVAEEGVGAEQGEDLVEDVVALAVRVGRLVGRQRRRRDREGVGGPARLGPEGEEREVADQAGDVGV